MGKLGVVLDLGRHGGERWIGQAKPTQSGALVAHHAMEGPETEALHKLSRLTAVDRGVMGRTSAPITRGSCRPCHRKQLGSEVNEERCSTKEHNRTIVGAGLLRQCPITEYEILAILAFIENLASLGIKDMLQGARRIESRSPGHGASSSTRQNLHTLFCTVCPPHTRLKPLRLAKNRSSERWRCW